MKRVLFTAAALAAGLALAVSASIGSAEEEKAEKKEKKKDEVAYVGPDACKKCHFKQARAWKKTRLKTSFDTLAPTTAEKDKALFDKKTKAKLDPAKDYRTDAKCLPCHTTGYGKKGGYPVKPDASEESKAQAKLMQGVSCEACHGPGGKYVKHKTDTLAADEDAKFTFEGLAKEGLIQPDEKNCATCHNKDNPAQPETAFEYKTAKDLAHPKKKKKKKKKK